MVLLATRVAGPYFRWGTIWKRSNRCCKDGLDLWEAVLVFRHFCNGSDGWSRQRDGLKQCVMIWLVRSDGYIRWSARQQSEKRISPGQLQESPFLRAVIGIRDNVGQRENFWVVRRDLRVSEKVDDEREKLDKTILLYTHGLPSLKVREVTQCV